MRAAASGPSCEAGSPPTAVRNTGLANFACRRPETFRAGLPTSTRGAHEQDLSTPNVRAEFACSVGLPGGPDGPLSTVPISARSSLSSPPQAPAGPLWLPHGEVPGRWSKEMWQHKACSDIDLDNRMTLAGGVCHHPGLRKHSCDTSARKLVCPVIRSRSSAPRTCVAPASRKRCAELQPRASAGAVSLLDGLSFFFEVPRFVGVTV